MSDEVSQGSPRKRRYRKRRRAELEERTRQRITEAAMRLHGSVGPARTTVSAVASEAGVQRATVYRHFPTDVELFEACSAHWLSLNPPPDPDAWSAIRDPGERLRAALAELYRWYGWAEPMLINVVRDAPLVPAMEGPMRAFDAAMREAQAVLLRGRPERGRNRRRVSASVALAFAFATWRSLTRDAGLDDDEAVALMVATVEGAGRVRQASGSPPGRRRG